MDVTHPHIHISWGDRPVSYRIKVLGRLDASWSTWFGGLDVSLETFASGVRVTTLTGIVADQSALHGLLARIRDLGLPLLSVECLDAPGSPHP